MRILGYIHSYNDAIAKSLEGLLRQTHPLDQILVIDNGSTSPLPEPTLSNKVTVIRLPENLGTSGAVKKGLEYALEYKYDWIWVLDADGVARDDALEKLVGLYDSLELKSQREVGLLCSAQILVPTKQFLFGRCMTPSGPRTPRIKPDCPYVECDANIWSGALFKLEAVRKVGMPRCAGSHYWSDFNLDYGDFEFTYRIRRAGYKSIVHLSSIVEQAVGNAKPIEIFGRPIVSTNHPAGRRYLMFRNLLYFWLYLYPKPQPLGFGLWFSYRFGITILKILLMEDNRARKMAACFQGALDGLRKRLDHAHA